MPAEGNGPARLWTTSRRRRPVDGATGQLEELLEAALPDEDPLAADELRDEPFFEEVGDEPLDGVFEGEPLEDESLEDESFEDESEDDPFDEESDVEPASEDPDAATGVVVEESARESVR